MYRLHGSWQNVTSYTARPYRCSYCGAYVGADKGYQITEGINFGQIRICPSCNRPTFFDGGNIQIPAVAFGNEVADVPGDVDALYKEARQCTSATAHTAAVLACRKILMHIAVDKGAKPGESFLSYVEYLAEKGYLPPDGKGWVTYIKDKGNEANHEIKLMAPEDSERLITFLEMLLRFIYEFPKKIPPLP